MKKLILFYQQYRVWAVIAVLGFGLVYSLVHQTRPPKSAISPTVSPNLATPALSNPPSPVADPSPSPTALPASRDPSPTSGDLSPISNPVIAPEYDSQTQTFYFIDATSQAIKSFNQKTRATTTLGQAPAYLETFIWGPDYQQGIAVVSNEVTEQLDNPLYDEKREYRALIVAHYNLTTKKLTALDPSIKAISFAGKDKIIYQSKTNAANSLMLAEPTGANKRTIAKLRDDVQISWAGQTALIYSLKARVIERYDNTGQRIDSYQVPDDFRFSQSLWAETGRDAIYWTRSNDQLTIHRLRPNLAEILTTQTEKEADLTILWDNKTGQLFQADYFGIRPLLVASD